MPIDLSSAIAPGEKREACLRADGPGVIPQPTMDGGDGCCEISPHDHARDR